MPLAGKRAPKCAEAHFGRLCCTMTADRTPHLMQGSLRFQF